MVGIAGFTLMGLGTGGAVLLMAGLWAVQRRTRNAGIVDFGWAASLGALAILYAWLGGGWEHRRILLAVVGGGWGFRLALHLLRDRVLGRPEEGRYVTLRANWQPHPDRAFFLFFQAQALLAVFLSLPFLLTAFRSTAGWTMTDGIGVALWGMGLAGESIADHQLARWKADPGNRGRTCRTGLWRYSRHPNYFFEWVIWCGFGTLGLAAPYGWLGILAPLTLLYSILRITGIPPAEAQALKSRGEDYRRYQRTTSAFVPWFPRRESRS